MHRAISCAATLRGRQQADLEQRQRRHAVGLGKRAPWPPEVQCKVVIAGALAARGRQAAAARPLVRLLGSDAGAAACRAHGLQLARRESPTAAR